MHPSEKIHTRTEGLDENFVWMEGELETGFKEVFDTGKKKSQILAIAGKNDKIISISDVVFDFQLMLHELIKIIHVDIDENLRSEIAERQALTTSICSIVYNRCVETFYDFIKKPECIIVSDMLFKNFKKYLMVYGGEEFLDVTLQNPALFGIILLTFQ